MEPAEPTKERKAAPPVAPSEAMYWAVCAAARSPLPFSLSPGGCPAQFTGAALEAVISFLFVLCMVFFSYKKYKKGRMSARTRSLRWDWWVMGIGLVR